MLYVSFIVNGCLETQHFLYYWKKSLVSLYFKSSNCNKSSQWYLLKYYGMNTHIIFSFHTWQKDNKKLRLMTVYLILNRYVSVSILCPLLIFSADLPRYVEHCMIAYYADTIFYHFETGQTRFSKMHNIKFNTMIWMINWKTVIGKTSICHKMFYINRSLLSFCMKKYYLWWWCCPLYVFVISKYIFFFLNSMTNLT